MIKTNFFGYFGYGLVIVFLTNEKIFKLDSLFLIKVYKKFFKDFYLEFLNEKRAFIFLVECISFFFLILWKR